MVERPDHLVGTDIAIYEADGITWGLDDDGEFKLNPPAGTDEPQDGRCGATLTASVRRYGEIRHCGQTPYWPADDSDEEASDFCKTHKGREQLMERAIELVKHGYFGQNYVVFEQAMDPHEFLFATEMFAGLLDMSQYEFDVQIEARSIDTSESDLIEEDEIVVDLPLPNSTKYQLQAQELWHAAVDEIKEQRMQHMVLLDGVSQETLVESADMEGRITDTKYEDTEHHLNLSISRLSKDLKERLKVGGVEIGADDDGELLTFQQNDYTLDVRPNEDGEDVEELEAMEVELEAPEPED